MEWKTIDDCIQEKSLLKHPFYQAWSKGQLTLEDLRGYAAQYYTLESNFPRFLSRIHASCEEPGARQKILENLNDEERGPENHRELWLRFAEGLGLSREEVFKVSPHPETEACVDTFLNLSAHPNYALGLAALYAYESQLPEISAVKLDGLKKFYGFDNSQATRFFAVHEELDRWHSQQEKEIIAASGIPLKEAHAAVEKACAALLGFLDGVSRCTRAGSAAICLH